MVVNKLLKHLFVCFAALLAVVLFPVAAEAKTLGRVTANRVNVRDAGSLTESNVLFMVNAGQECEIIGIVGDYYHVNLPDRSGVYIAREYVEIIGDEPDETAASDEADFDEPAVPLGREPDVGPNGRTNGSVTANRVNVRDAASLNSNVLFKVDAGQRCEVTGIEGDFYRVAVNGNFGLYIAREYVKLISHESKLLMDGVWVYESPPGESGGAGLLILSRDAVVEIYSAYEDWYYVSYKNVYGYIPKSAAKIPAHFSLPSNKPSVRQPNATGLAAEIISYARSFIGTKYASAGTSPQKGFDCSGFVSYVLSNFDISVGRSSRDMAARGAEVQKASLQPGDLVFFATSGGRTISHVGIFIGDGLFVHSSSWGKGVMVSSLDEAYYVGRYVKATRVI